MPYVVLAEHQVGSFVRCTFQRGQADCYPEHGATQSAPTLHLGRHKGGPSFREPTPVSGDHRMTQQEWLPRIEELEREQRAHYSEGRDAQGDAVGVAIRFLINEGRAHGYALPDGRPPKTG